MPAFEHFLGNLDFADFTLKCQGRTWQLHRAIVCAQSKFFLKALSGAFLESGIKEVDLKEDDPELIDLMVRFFYTSKYKARPECDYSQKSGLERSKLANTQALFHVSIHTLAQKFDVELLEDFASDQFQQCLYRGKARITLELLRAVYLEGTDLDGRLRMLLVKKLASRKLSIFEPLEAFNVRQILDSGDNFTEFFAKYAKERESCLEEHDVYRGEWCYECPDCQTEFACSMSGEPYDKWSCPKCRRSRFRSQWDDHHSIEYLG